MPAGVIVTPACLSGSGEIEIGLASDGLFLDADRLGHQLLGLDGAAIIFAAWRRGMPALNHDARLDGRRLVGNPDPVGRHRSAADGEGRRALFYCWIHGAAGDQRGDCQCRGDGQSACLHVLSLIVMMTPGDGPLRTAI